MNEPPLFFASDILSSDKNYMLDETNSRHCVQVLRMQPGDHIAFTDGKGYHFDANIINADRKHCEVNISKAEKISPLPYQIQIGVAFSKQSSRTEWMIEKITEIGAHTIYPLICERTTKEHYNINRLQHIMVAALQQSQQYYLPVLHQPVEFNKLLETTLPEQKFIAHCLPNEKTTLQQAVKKNSNIIILIGPEGDFTEEEIKAALQHHFVPVSLGTTRLRTETAGIVACTLLNSLLQQ